MTPRWITSCQLQNKPNGMQSPLAGERGGLHLLQYLRGCQALPVKIGGGGGSLPQQRGTPVLCFLARCGAPQSFRASQSYSADQGTGRFEPYQGHRIWLFRQFFQTQTLLAGNLPGTRGGGGGRASRTEGPGQHGGPATPRCHPPPPQVYP